MANLFPARARINPHFAEPDLIVTYAQASGAFEALQGGKPRVKIGPDDLYVYVNALDLRTEAQAAGAPSNMLPSASLVGEQFGTPTYLVRTRSIWDRHDTAAAANYNVSLPAAQALAARQGHYQQYRTALLYGYNPAKGEGLLNAPNAVQVTLPPDPYGATTFSTYDNGAMAQWLLNQIVSLKISMFQSGGKIHNKIVVISPQRIFLQAQIANIVQVTSYQRPGAGTQTTANVAKSQMEEAGDDLAWYFDDTLIGKGAAGSDAVILTIPEVEVPDLPGINTNAFGEVSPAMKAVNVMYAAMAAPIEIPTPTPDGAITTLYENRISSGWNVRGAGLYILSVPY